MKPERISVDEAAARLGISKHTLRAWLKRRRLPFARIGRRIVLDAADIEAFVQARRVEALPEHAPAVAAS